MKSMIYFPSFELQDKTWLRIALLYFEELRPIIPNEYYARQHSLSVDAIKIMDSTDLIRSYSPNYDKGRFTAILAIEEFDRYLANPYVYSYPFFQRDGVNLLEKWRNPINQTTELFSEKYSHDFERYCLKNKLAIPSDNGILISQELAFVYMSFLADTIAKIDHYETFTDLTKYDLILRKNEIFLSGKERFDFNKIKEQIEFYVPDNLINIPLERIIKLRNDKDFKQLRREYVQQYESYLRQREDNPELTFEKVVSSKRDIIQLIEHAFGAFVSVFLTIHDYNKIQEGSFDPAEGLANLYTQIDTVKNIPRIPKIVQNLQSKYRAKKYVKHLSLLSRKKQDFK